MKAALNGGLNLSILDGWWDEWYDGNNGWAIPSADGVDDPDRRDDLEANALYDLHRERGRAALLRRRRRGRAHALAGDGPPHAQVARPQGAGHPPGARLRARALRPGRPHRRARSTPTTPVPASSRSGSSDVRARVAGACASSTSTPRASATPPRSGATLAVRAFVALGDLVGRRRRGAGRPRPDRRRRRAARPATSAMPMLAGSPTTATGTASTPTCRSTARARSATRSASCRATSRWPRSPSSVWSPSPPDVRRQGAAASGGRARRERVAPAAATEVAAREVGVRGVAARRTRQVVAEAGPVRLGGVPHGAPPSGAGWSSQRAPSRAHFASGLLRTSAACRR